jgi:hypothetical protein
MKAKLYIASIKIIIVASCFVSSSVHAQNTGEILIIPKNADEVTSSDGIKFSKKDKAVVFPSGLTIELDFDLDSPDNSIKETDRDQDK